MAAATRTRAKALKTTVRAGETRSSRPARTVADSTEITPEERLLGALFGKQASGYQAAEIVERGLPTASVEILRDEGLTFSEVHDLVLPARTLKHRIVRKESLSIEETDRTLRVAKVLALAEQVFGNHEKALGWLRRPNRRLKDRAPIELLRSEVGGELIRQMLYQIDEGIYV
jgi:putative toxin-antitoxin system antitoxin component (TIGR02293 family)